LSVTDNQQPEGEILKANNPGRDQVKVNMDVMSLDGEHLGKVKEIRATEFLLDRPLARDLWVPFSVVIAAEDYGGTFRRGPVQATEIVLNVGGASVDQQGWQHA
jgi:hypothetical protein